MTQQNFTQPNLTRPPAQLHYNIWAILGFVFAFIMVPLGLIFSIIGLLQIKRDPLAKGRGLALAGVVISSMVILAFVGLLTWGVVKGRQVIQKAQLKLTDTEIVSAAKDQQSLADDAYITYKGYPSSTYDHSLDTSGLIGLVAGINPYKSFMLFSPQGQCAAHQDQYGYFPYKNLTTKASCSGGDKGDCQAYEIRFCLQAASGEFKAGDNVISREGTPPPSPAQVQDTQRIAEIKQLQAALERYHSDHHNTYPTPAVSLSENGKLCETGFVYAGTTCVTTYLSQLSTLPAGAEGLLGPFPTPLFYNSNPPHTTYSIELHLSQPQGNLSTANCARPSGITSGACPNTWAEYGK